jgi:HEAT repeats/HEAT repeat associated with sister chromatid cohesion
MPERRRAGRRVAVITAGAVLVTGAVLVIKYGGFMAGVPASRTAGTASAVHANSPLADLNKALTNNDFHALPIIQERATPKPKTPMPAFTEQEAGEWIETLGALRSGFRRMTPAGRVAALAAACRIFDRFAVEPAPREWVLALKPLHDLLSAGLADSDPQPRYAALQEISRCWVWIPGRSITPVEEQTLAEWKGGIYIPVLHCLASRDVATRVATVACLGTLPIDDAAASAVAYVDDPEVDVRRQTLSSFAQRNLLLTEDMLLKHLHDEDAVVRDMANLILKTRGLSQELIGLGGLIFSPRADQRVSVITLLKGRTDVDPVTWLVQLSKDPVETVRMSSLAALAEHKTPVAQIRLSEMARKDASEAVRQAARKLLTAVDETTASRPPLPGSSSLNPKAN